MDALTAQPGCYTTVLLLHTYAMKLEEHMQSNTTPEGRTAVEAETGPGAAVTLMNHFQVPEGRDEMFLQLWTQTSHYFRRQPGFLSLRLHRAVTPGAGYRYVNVARSGIRRGLPGATHHRRIPPARHSTSLAGVPEQPASL